MPGWWQEMRQKARECEACDSGQWAGIVSKVRALLGDFRPSSEEAKEWHIDLSLDERIALAGQEKQGLSREKAQEQDKSSAARGGDGRNAQDAGRYSHQSAPDTRRRH